MDNIPTKGGLVLVANHVSAVDPPLLGVVMKRPVHFMAKKELFSFGPFGAVLKKIGAFPVNRDGVDRTAVKQAIAVVSDGMVLGMFPEGTRSKDGLIQKAHSGAALISMKTGVPVVPVGILGLETSKKSTFFVRKPIKVVIGNRMDPPASGGARIDRDLLSKYTEDIMTNISNLMSSDNS